MSPERPDTAGNRDPDDVEARGGQVRRRAVIYTRTAAPESPASHASHALQEERCRAEPHRLDLDLVAVIHDRAVPAGLTAENSGWLRVAAMARGRQVDVVLTYDFTRLTRFWADVGFPMPLGEKFEIEFQTPSGSDDTMSRAARRVARKSLPLDRGRPRPPGAHRHVNPTEGNH